MRVISGQARGLKLKSPEGLNTRPTADRIKECLFNILNNNFHIRDSLFLDLFSGSGAIGIEALSRGAKHCFFIDNSFESVDCINYNVTKANLLDYSTIIKKDIKLAINDLSAKKYKFDFIFLDPPYNNNLIETTITYICNNDILSEDGIIICEQSINDSLPTSKKVEVFRIKEFKVTKLIFLKHLNMENT